MNDELQLIIETVDGVFEQDQMVNVQLSFPEDNSYMELIVFVSLFNI